MRYPLYIFFLLITFSLFSLRSLHAQTLGDTLRQKIIVDVCNRLMGPEYQWAKGNYILLNPDLNYKGIDILTDPQQERYKYRESKYDSLLLLVIAERFSLNLDLNFFVTNEYHEYEYIVSSYAGDSTFMAVNKLNNVKYFKIGKPVEDWDLLYILQDADRYFKFYKKVGNKRLFINVPVVNYEKSKNTAGIERKFIYQYEVVRNKNSFEPKFIKRVQLDSIL